MQAHHTSYAQAETMVFPEAITLKILLSGSQSDGQLAIFEDIVEAGVGPPRHIHHHQDETFFFLEGEFDVEVGGQLYHMTAGDVAFIPKGTVHAFKNVGTSAGRLRYIFSPALEIEEMFRAFYQSLQEGNFSEEQMSRTAAQYGQEMVGPSL